MVSCELTTEPSLACRGENRMDWRHFLFKLLLASKTFGEFCLVIENVALSGKNSTSRLKIIGSILVIVSVDVIFKKKIKIFSSTPRKSMAAAQRALRVVCA